MLQSLSAIPLLAYLAFNGFVKKFKNDERGLSGVVVAVLLILVAILAIVLIWVFLGDWIRTMWDTIIEKSEIS